MVCIRLLGEMAVEVDGCEVDLPSGRPRSLLAWLALNRGTHRRGEVAARFWPDILDANARASLRTALWTLRRALGPESDSALTATRDRVGLKAGSSSIWTDIDAFDELVGDEKLEAALELCRGDLLADLDDDWVLEARDAHRDRVGDVLSRLGEEAEQSGDLSAAIAWAEHRIELDPLEEDTHRELIRRLTAYGDRVRALKAYRRLRDMLAAELGIAPSARTRELVGSLRLEEQAAGLRLGQEGTDGGDDDHGPRERGITDAGWEPGRPFPLPPRLRSALSGPFVGRSTELQRLTDVVDEAEHASEPRLALITGEAGAGKTRLIAELTSGMKGSVCLYGEAERPAMTAYRPFAEALAHYAAVASDRELERRLAAHGPRLTELIPVLRNRLPELSEAAGENGEGPPGETIDAIVSVIGELSQSAPTVLCLDDVQWLDRSSEVVLKRLLGLGPPARLMVIAACREEELAPSGPLAEALANPLTSHTPERIGLGGLEPGEVDQMLSDRTPRGELGATIHAKSNGNPFFVKEMLRHLDEQPVERSKQLGLPDGIKPLLRRRLDALGEECVRMLRIAAVAGQRFELRLLERVSNRDGDELCEMLDEAVRAGILEEDLGGFERFGFSHDLMRDALLGELSHARRARIHARIAEATEELSGGSDEALPALAHHWCEAGRAGDPDRAVDLAMRAAERASARREYGEAVDLYSRGLAVVPESDDRRRAMLIRRGVDYMRLEHFLWVRLHGVRVPGGND